jgi:hypothetical protein
LIERTLAALPAIQKKCGSKDAVDIPADARFFLARYKDKVLKETGITLYRKFL